MPLRFVDRRRRHEIREGQEYSAQSGGRGLLQDCLPRVRVRLRIVSNENVLMGS